MTEASVNVAAVLLSIAAVLGCAHFIKALLCDTPLKKEVKELRREILRLEKQNKDYSASHFEGRRNLYTRINQINTELAKLIGINEERNRQEQRKRKY